MCSGQGRFVGTYEKSKFILEKTARDEAKQTEINDFMKSDKLLLICNY